MCEGNLTSWSKNHQQKYLMETKLNEKDVKSLAENGSKDSNMGMLVPHQFDMSAVKEVASLGELEKLQKEVERSYLNMVCTFSIRRFH